MRSDSAHIILDRVRSTLNLLKKSNMLYSTPSSVPAVLPTVQVAASNHETQQRENPILLSFKDLQMKVRFLSGTVDSMDVVNPFLLILRARNMAGPFKLAALEALSCFINYGIINGNKRAISEIIDAVIRCKFIQTDFAGDEMVQLYLVRTLRQIVIMREESLGIKTFVREHLSDDDLSAILDFCLTVVWNTCGAKRALALHYEAEQTTLDIIRGLSCSLSMQKNESGSDKINLIQPYLHPVGSVTLLRSVDYFISVLHGAANGMPVKKGLGLDRNMDSNAFQSTSSSQKNNLPPTPTLGDLSLDADTLHLIFSLKTLQSIITCWGDMTASRSLIICIPRLRSLFCDELGSALLKLCSKRDSFPPLVLQLCLSLFCSLYTVFSPCIRVLTECFLKQIYIKALHQGVEIFMAQLENLMERAEASVGSSAAPSIHSPNFGGANNFVPMKLEELEVVIESLCDLLSDSGFLPTIFASFDCDPSSNDIMQPMIQYLCQCARIVINSASDELGANREFGVLIIQAYKQVMASFLHRTTLIEAVRVLPESLSVTYLQTIFFASRHAKYTIQAAAKLFCVKPSDGIRYLQRHEVLPTPATPRAVARFLRVASELSKEAVGSYLGELGKDQPNFEVDGKSFHEQVLQEYVRSFSLSGQGVLNCMRVFLSAFRLPGEAQQIDRILVAFSEHCHSSCLEGRSGLLENPEVTYLLTFSIIMLNTDRHNPNIRQDRRMTLDQFIRNNTNYGKDVNQTRPLPREFLESIFASICEHQIRTEQNGISASITSEVWMEMQLSARDDSRKEFLITVDGKPNMLADLRNNSTHGNSYSNMQEGQPIEISPQLIARQLLTAENLEEGNGPLWQLFHDPLAISLVLCELPWLFDQDMMRCVWKDLLLVCISVHMSNFRVVKGAVSSIEREGSKLKSWQRERTGRALHLSNEFIADLLRVCNHYHLQTVLDTVSLLLGEFTAMTQQEPQNNIAEKIFDLLDYFPIEVAPNVAFSPETFPLPSLLRENCNPTILNAPFEPTNIYLDKLARYPSARLALFSWINLLQKQTSLVSSSCYPDLWAKIGYLRDCALLPSQMILEMEAEQELLPSTVRAQLDATLKKRDRSIISQLMPELANPRLATPTAPTSFLSLQSIGAALFGTSDTLLKKDDTDTEKEIERQDRIGVDYGESYRLDSFVGMGDLENSSKSKFLPYESPLCRHNLPSARWDLGYEQSDSFSPEISQTESNSQLQSAASTTATTERVEKYLTIIARTKHDTRQLLIESGIEQLFSDSRFLEEDKLQLFLKSLISAVESDQHGNISAESNLLDSGVLNSELGISSTILSCGELAAKAIEELSGRLRKRQRVLSAAAVSWLEMLLVEVALRNRDRFASIWPLLRDHYTRTIGPKSVSMANLSYIAERRVVGLLKVSTRMISREHYAKEILQLLGDVFATPRVGYGEQNEGGEFVSDKERSNFPHSTELSNQLAAGVWALLTLNVDILPSLHLEQWQILFAIIAVCSASDQSYAAVKAFEVMAWLLHEPRLIAKVPVFCIIGVRPLLTNQFVPLSVSLGAVGLLSHLHSRLEVLIMEENDEGEEVEEADTGTLWENCWLPILRLLAEGASDSRREVRSASIGALYAAVLDKHINAVPNKVLVEVLGDILSPVITLLGSFAQLEENGSADNLQLIESDGDWTRISFETQPLIEGTKDAVLGAGVLCERGLAVLSSLLLRFTPRLLQYPSFDKLWIRVVFVLGSLLGPADSRLDLEINTTADEDMEMLSTLGKVALFRLRELRSALHELGVFRRREGLSKVTVDSLRLYRGTNALLNTEFKDDKQ